MSKLSMTSRILVAVAAGALLALYFLPAWRIDLFAPQYPEGLVMKIWIFNITGDVDIINGLNHYIGMKHISVDMFPELKFIPYVVAFFILFGMLVSVTGSRKVLFVYLLLLAIGALAIIYDFYKWGYDYGHNLDPKAAIQVPGLSYQPPLFGHKRLLNFDAYSFPDVAGWIVVISGILSFGVWFKEWFREYKTKRRIKAQKIVPTSIGPILAITMFVSCNVNPEPFQLAKDACSNCKMSIADPRFGGETITKKGKLYKFDDLRCMVTFLRSGTVAKNEIKLNVAVNYEKQNQFLDVNTAQFLSSPEFKSPMGSNTAAFESKEAAQKTNIIGELIEWNALKDKWK